ncbi:MAG: OmpA family protein [Candidatus Kapabacteria bacterium]|jgi:outer membrane protein OmpA-like peptidoglycan-associated protein/Mg-chelatase subunit ChlD|nr:OmpA family protein [Candidatus Kapabacteria bacterium]
MRFLRPFSLQQPHSASRQFILIPLWCALALALTACPHHIEQMVEKLAPPKNYKPSYTTSSTSLKKMLEQNKSALPNSTKPTTGAKTQANTPSFDPSILSSFPYASELGKMDIGKALARVTSGTLGGLDSSVFAGKIPNMGALSSTATRTIFSGDSVRSAISNNGIPNGFPSGLPDIGGMMQGMLNDSTLRQTLASGQMDSLVNQFKNFGDLGDNTARDGMSSQQAMERFLKDSSFKKMLASIPTGLPDEVLENLTEQAADVLSAPGSDDEINEKKSSSKPQTKSKTSDKTKPQEQSSTKKSPAKNSSKTQQSNKTDSPSNAQNQGFGGMTEKLAQMLPQMTAMKQDYERAAKQYAEREAQAGFEKIAEAEEREAQRIAAEPSIAPLAVHIRSINDERYPREVELNVTVTDTTGRFISGLAPPNFQGKGNYREYWRALTDSCPQMTSQAETRVRSFEVEEVSEGSLDTHAVAFVLDHSPSMGNTRALRLQEAVARTMGIVKKQDYITAIKFTSKIKVEVPLTNDTNAYRNGFLIDGLEGYGGGTAIYDGVLAAVNELKKAPKGASKVIILFTDGEDNGSKSRISAAYKAAKENNVRIFSISYGVTDERPLQNLSQYTGGVMYRLYSVKEFPLAFADLYKALKNYYRVRYRPPECASVHDVRLRLVVPEFVSVSTGTAEYDRSVFTPLDTVGSVQLVNIEFETGKATIRQESLPLLRDIAAYIKRTPKTMMEIRGHTDNRGGTEANQKLSEARATAVLTALLGMGVPKSQIRAVGFGEAQPLAGNDTEENRRRNRRTEFAIVEK